MQASNTSQETMTNPDVNVNKSLQLLEPTEETLRFNVGRNWYNDEETFADYQSYLDEVETTLYVPLKIWCLSKALIHKFAFLQ